MLMAMSIVHITASLQIVKSLLILTLMLIRKILASILTLNLLS